MGFLPFRASGCDNTLLQPAVISYYFFSHAHKQRIKNDMAGFFFLRAQSNILNAHLLFVGNVSDILPFLLL
jgi:hypothetical protein